MTDQKAYMLIQAFEHVPSCIQKVNRSKPTVLQVKTGANLLGYLKTVLIQIMQCDSKYMHKLP